MIICPHCKRSLSQKFIVQARNSLIQGAGRKPVLAPCKWCRREMGAQARKTHEPRCARNPRNA